MYNFQLAGIDHSETISARENSIVVSILLNEIQ